MRKKNTNKKSGFKSKFTFMQTPEALVTYNLKVDFILKENISFYQYTSR